MKICLPIFNRATYGRTKVLIREIAKAHDLTLVLSSALLEIEFGNAQTYIKEEHPDAKIKVLETGKHPKSNLGMCLTSADILRELAVFVEGEGFDAAVVVADRFETLPAAMGFALLHIPQIHIQGGEVTGSIDEKIRHSVTKLSDYHVATTQLAGAYLKRMGEHPNRVLRGGCPSLDLITSCRIRRRQPKYKDRFIISMFHPDTTCKEGYEQTEMVMNSVINYANKYDLKCHWYLPNPDPGRERIIKFCEEVKERYPKRIEWAVNEPPEVFLKRLSLADFIIGNSSCGLREASFMGTGCINLGDRQRMRERSWNVIDCDFDGDSIDAAMEYHRSIYRHKSSQLYGSGNAVRKIMQWIDSIRVQIKGPLTYPNEFEFLDLHFSERRYEEHKKPRKFNKKKIAAVSPRVY